MFGVSLYARHRAMPLGFCSELRGSYYDLVGEKDKEREKKPVHGCQVTGSVMGLNIEHKGKT